MPDTSQLVFSTSALAFVTGFFLGIYAIRGYLIPESWTAERQGNIHDPLESDESDIDEDDTILDHAPNWANGKEADRRDGLRQEKLRRKRTDTSDAPVADNGNEECKLVLVVRTDLGMTKGKIAAQCSHATLACYKSLSSAAAKKGSKSAESRLLSRWERYGQAKIAVQTKSEEELKTLQATAREIGVTAEVIADAGRTQIESGSLTVLGVGPAPKSLVDTVTGHLKLL